MTFLSVLVAVATVIGLLGGLLLLVGLVAVPLAEHHGPARPTRPPARPAAPVPERSPQRVAAASAAMRQPSRVAPVVRG